MKLGDMLIIAVAALGFIQEASKNLASGNMLLAGAYILGLILIGGVFLYAKLKKLNLFDNFTILNKVSMCLMFAIILPSDTAFWIVIALIDISIGAFSAKRL